MTVPGEAVLLLRSSDSCPCRSGDSRSPQESQRVGRRLSLRSRSGSPRRADGGSGSPRGREKPAGVLGCALLGPKAAKCHRVTVGAGHGRLPGIVCAHVPGHGTCSHPPRPRRWLSLPNVPAWVSCFSSVHRAALDGAVLPSPRGARSSS